MNRVLAVIVLVFAGLAGIFVVQLVRGGLLAIELASAADARAARIDTALSDGDPR